MYELALFLHSWLRWLVLAFGLTLLVTARRGWRRDTEWDGRADRLRAAFLGLLDLQAVLGLTLYFGLSPLTRVGLADVSVAMGDSVLRFYTIEHAFGMATGVIVAHIGLGRAKKGPVERRHRMTFLTLLVWLAVTVGSIPWSGLPYGRPLLRW